MRSDQRRAARPPCRLVVALAAVLALAASGALPAFAQEEEAEVAPEMPSAVVELDGAEILVVVGGQTVSAEVRADRIEARLLEAAELNIDSPPVVTVVPSEFGPTLLVDGRMVTIVTDVDVEFEGFDAATVAKIYVDQIEPAVAAFRAGRSAGAVRSGLGRALLLTAAFAALVFGLFKARSHARRLGEARIDLLLQDIERSSGRVIDATALRAAQRLFLRGLGTLILALLAYGWVAMVLREIAYTKWLASILLDTIAEPLITLGKGALAEIPDLLTVIVLVLVVRYILRLNRLFFKNIENGLITFKGFDTRWTWPTHRLARFAIIVFGVVIAYPYIPGSETQAFQGMTILLGLVVSVGSSSVTGNLLAGLIVVYKKSVNIGDRVRVGALEGHVEAVSLLDTHIRTLKNEMASVPNMTLLGSEIVNYTNDSEGSDQLIHATVGIGYEEPRQKIERLLIDAAIATPGLRATPRPFVLRRALGSHDVSYEVNACRDGDGEPVRLLSDLHASILDRFQAAGVQIMTPFYVGDPDEPKVPPPG